MRVSLQGTKITRGQYMGEEGTGYRFLEPGECARVGDVSRITDGHYQGQDFAAVGELDDSLSLRDSYAAGLLAFGARETRHGLDAQECISLGYLRVESCSS